MSAIPDYADAITVGGVTLSGEELHAAASAVAADVAGHAVVAVHATPTIETVVAIIGALAAGAAVVPLPPDAGTAELTHLLADSGATGVLAGGSATSGRSMVSGSSAASGSSSMSGISALFDGSVAVAGPASAGGPAPAPNRPVIPGRLIPDLLVIPVDVTRRSSFATGPIAPDHTALILYTSGTTGPPKGVMISHGAIEAGIDALIDAWAWAPDDVLVHGLPLFHVHGLVLGVLGPLRAGSRLVHTGRPTPGAYAAARGSLYFGVPTVWSRICAEPSAAAELAGARLLVSGSAPLPVPVFEKLRALTGHEPVERYGMTETLITVSSRADGLRRPGYVGFPLAGVATRLVAEDGSDVPRDGESIGELQVTGPMLGSGYWRQPAATAASRTEDGWFRTGDIAAIDPDGWHRIVGRASTDLIKSGGYRVGAGEVEDALLAHPGVSEAAVIGEPHADLGEQITAFVVAEGINEAELIAFVAQYLSVHKRPRVIRFVDVLPRNAMGKVQKRHLHS